MERLESASYCGEICSMFGEMGPKRNTSPLRFGGCKAEAGPWGAPSYAHM